MAERRRIDPVLRELRKLLPPDVDIVAVPAEEGLVGEVSEHDAAAAEAQARRAVELAHRLLAPARGATGDLDVRWIRSTDGRHAVCEASSSHRLTTEPPDLEPTLEALVEAGWRAKRSDRGRVQRLLAATGEAALEVQVRRGEGVVAVRARSAPVPVTARAGTPPTPR